MAERRAIKAKIWEDEFFGELSLLAQLIWIGIFSRCVDDQGRMVENLSIIKSQIFPYKDIPLHEIAACLDEIDGHLIRYEVDGKKYIQITKWWDNQPMQYATPSNYPAPKDWDDRYRTTYKGTQIVFNWLGKNGIENNEAGMTLHTTLAGLGRVSSWVDYVGSLNHNLNPTPNLNPNKPLPTIYEFYESEISPITPTAADVLDLYVKELGEDDVRYAITEAVKHNARKLAYIQSILDRIKVNGRKEPDKKNAPVMTWVEQPDGSFAPKEVSHA